MIPASFDYHRAASVEEAIGLLSRYGPDAKVLSGGMSLLPALKLRLGMLAHVVDISRIAALEYVREEGGAMCIGAGTRQCVLEKSESIAKAFPILADALPLIADPLVRNRGTIGGNVANGDPANDGPAIVIALGAELVARGAKGERRIPAASFYRDFFVTDLAPDEILVEIRLPLPRERSGSAYRKLKRKTGDFAVAAAAVRVELDAKGKVRGAGIALTNAGATPVQAVQAEKALIGKAPGEKVVAEAASLAAKAASPSADRRGSGEYKRDMCRVLCARALSAALDRARGN